MNILKKFFGGSRKPSVPTPPVQKNNPYEGQIRLRINDNKDWIWNDFTALNNQNFIVLGEQGAGKTQTIRALSSEWALDVPKTIIIDYKDDYSDNDYLKKMSGKTYRLKSEPLPFNPMLPNSFDNKPIRDIKYRLQAVISNYSGTVGGNQEEEIRGAIELYLEMFALKDIIYMSNTIKNAIASKPKAQQMKVKRTFIKLCNAIGIEEIDLDSEATIEALESFMIDNLDNVPNFLNFVEVSINLELLNGAFVGKVLKPLAEFNIFPENSITFEEFMKRERTSVLGVKGMYSEDMQNLISLVIVEFLEAYRANSDKSKIINKKYRAIECVLIIDEAKTILRDKVDSLLKFLKEGREFGYVCVFGSQFIDDFRQVKKVKYDNYFPTVIQGKNRDFKLDFCHFLIDGSEEPLYIKPYFMRG